MSTIYPNATRRELRLEKSQDRQPAEVPVMTHVGKDDLRKLFSDPYVVWTVALFLGIPPVDMEEPFRCILPGHEKSFPAATLCRNRRGVIVYRDSHVSGFGSFLTLPEVYFARATGEIRMLRGPTGATWALRLLADARILEPFHVDLPELAATASPEIRKVYEGFKELLALKWTYETGAQPTPFSHRFAAEWCGVSEKTASEAIRELLRLEIIRIAGYMPGPFGKPMALFAPGLSHDDCGRTPAPIPASQSPIGGSLNDN